MLSRIDRDLLLNVLALHLDFISVDEFRAAMLERSQDPTQSFNEILRKKGMVRDDDLALLNVLADRHIEMHGGNPRQSLTNLNFSDSVAKELKLLDDPQIDATLSFIPGTRSVDRSAEGASHRTQPTPDPRFRIVRPHAKGGLGEVFVATDQELNREVALKEIQARFADEPDSRSRFRLEAEITGNLEHPGIVPVYGLGEHPDGRPYYAMRFIRGESFKEAIEQFHSTRLTGTSFDSVEFRQLLGRFIDVCQAIAYAHSRGVLHRDLKPGNIILGKYGETLVVDWGLAKVRGTIEQIDASHPPLQPASASGSAPTVLGTAIGTPAYMSPEQAAGRVDELGPATDVYSLGATLYQLLTGQMPLRANSLPEVLELAQTGTFPRPREVQSQLPRALEAICLRAMARQPDQRYASPAGLAEDLERFLADEPVSAYVEPFNVRARRWIKRHPAIVSATAACMVLGLASAVFVAWLNGQHAAALADKNVTIAGQFAALQERAGTIAKQKTELETKNQQLTVATSEALAAEKIAVEQKAQAESVTNFLVASFRRTDPEFDGKKLTVYECLVRGRSEIDNQPNLNPLSKARILTAMVQSFVGLGLGIEAIDAGERCLAIRRQELGDKHSETLASQHNLGAAYVIAGQPEKAIPLLEPILVIHKEQLGPAHPDTLQTQNALAVAYKNAGRLDQAIRLQKSTLEALRSAVGKNHPLTLTCQHNLALAHATAGDRKTAISLLEQTLEAQKSALGNDHPDSLLTQSHLATSYGAAGRPDLAIPVLESVLKTQQDKLGADHPALFVTQAALARAYQLAGKLDESIALNEETLRGQKEKLGERHPHTLQTQNNLAMAYLDAKKYDLGIPLAETALKILREDFGKDHPDTLLGQMNLATLYHGSGKLDLAIPEYEATLKGFKATLGDDHSRTLDCQSNLAVALRSAGKNKQAMPLFEATLNARQLKEGPEHPDTLEAEYNLALAMGTDGQQEAALRRLQATTLVACRRTGGFPEGLWELLPEMVRKYDRAGKLEFDDVSTAPALKTILDDYDKPTPQSASALADLSLQLLRRENFTDAEPLCLACLATAKKVAPESWLMFQAQSFLGASLAGQRKFAEAEPLLKSGYEGLVAQEAQIPSAAKTAIVDAIQRLIDLYSAWDKSAETDKWRAEWERRKAGAP